MKKVRLKRLLFISFLSVVLLVIAVSSLIFFNKDKILPAFNDLINENIQGDVSISNAELIFWETFPSLSIKLSDVQLIHTDTLLDAKTISLNLQILPLIISNEVKVKGLKISQGSMRIERELGEKWNWTGLFSDSSNSNLEGGYELAGIQIDLNTIGLQFDDDVSQTSLSANVENGSLSYSSGNLGIIASLHSEFLRSRNRELLIHQKLEIRSALETSKEKVVLKKVKLSTKDLVANLNGAYTIPSSDLEIDFVIEDESLQVFKLLNLERILDQIGKNQIKATANYKGVLTGNINGRISLSSDIEARNSEVILKEYDQQLQGIDLKGKINLHDINSFKNVKLEIESYKGFLNSKPIEGSVVLDDLQELKGSLSISTIQELSRLANITGKNSNDSPLKDISGSITVDMEYQGSIGKDFYKTKGFQLSGDVFVENLTSRLRNGWNYSDISGNLILNNNQIALNDIKGQFNGERFSLTGSHKGFFDYLVDAKNPLILDVDIFLEKLDLNDSLSFGETKPVDSKFEIPSNWNIKLNTSIKELNYQKLSIQDLKGNFRIAQESITASDLNFSENEGVFKANGSLLKLSDGYNSYLNIHSENIQLDKFFNSFSNFNQSFLKSENLKGLLDFKSGINVNLDSELTPNWSSLKAIFDLTIMNGELNDFEPVMALQSYFKKEDLQHLKFGELKNEIIIDKAVIRIPKMEIQSNVRNIEIEGIHSFDKKIDYHVKIPLKNTVKQKVDKDSRYGRVEEVESGTSNIFLHISGNSDDFKTKVDKSAIAQKVKDDIKKELSELKKALKNEKDTTGKKVELSEEEFDF
ncbi:MAG: AsmA-like C-terminal region-containing protein [Bacteroidota bacterium]